MTGKPKIHVIGAGGTIAGTAPSAVTARYESGVLSAADLVAAVGGLDRLADIEAETLFSTGSEDLGPVQWLKLARRVQDLVGRDDVDGVVITHGTDTLEEAAFYLDLVCRTEKPVVMTAAMRPATALGADGPANIYQAFLAVTSPQLRGCGIMVVMNGFLLPGWQVVKTNSVALDSFRTYPGGPAGRMLGDRLTVTEMARPAPLAGVFHGQLAGSGTLPEIGIVHLFGGCGDAPIRAIRDAGYAGVVIAAFGAGTLPAPLAKAACELAAEGCSVVVSSRVAEVAVHPETMTYQAGGGLFASGFLNPQKSAVLLSLALAAGKDGPEIGRLFDRFAAGAGAIGGN